ncbi:ABC transporter ATP-binding protein [Rhodococcus sp. ABRD24]|uniref:ABC transporter ATP-binding protein n=1 Tax=Rhodococcus sp. ABRD24 TaxID=2507582 RepID=UPI00103EC9CD|nr:ABC transporter ATP-binding protein [Rhodococcus sp. ABRD24]QBJ94833.1 ABC transporter ATP-binding protein [Rhodococcus sp. ABRD24]
MTSSTLATGIRAHGLARAFGAVHAVRAMDFVAEPGEVTALIGPNGSGKTTLLLMLASLLRPDAGTIDICGHDPTTDTAQVRALLGWMPDTLGMWESLTAREILLTVARLYGIGPAAARQRTADLLDTVKLGDLADTPARAFSRGQQQRLSLARALVNDPLVLLLDEPASGLDPGARIELRVLLRRLATEGRTVVVSSHVLADLDEMADRAVFVADGRTVRMQTLAEAGAQARTFVVRALDPTTLDVALARAGRPLHAPADHRPGDRVIIVENDSDAAHVLRALVADGVAVTEFGPATGTWEQTYLSMQEAQ